MRKSYRLVVIIVLLVAVAAGAIQAHIDRNRALDNVRDRLQSLSLGLEDTIASNLERGHHQKLARLLAQFSAHAQVVSAVICSQGRAVAVDASLQPWTALCSDPLAREAEAHDSVRQRTERAAGHDYLIFMRPIETETAGAPAYSLVLVRSLDEVDAAARDAFLRSLLIALVSGLLAYVFLQGITQWILRRSVQYLARWTRQIFRSEAPPASAYRDPIRVLPPEFRELTRELSSLALKMRHERLKLVWDAAAAEPAAETATEAAPDPWAKVRRKVADVLKGRQLVIVANREPYLHNRLPDGRIQVVRPASGVVTALEPIMRLCGGGLWVGHGSGSADREVVDARDEVRVPPENPTYTLKRVWLTKEEEDGYYYGFANEGLWPLCHLAYTRPTFRLQDWESYCGVNEKFADAVLGGLKSENAVILVQDYHYALLPRILRERAPQASIELFWHIPWPNPEAFGICPQYKELLEGMLGADVVGFHTQFHCNNFLETCDRYLECRVDWERFSVTIGNRETLVRSYPISIATEPVRRLSATRREELRAQYGISTPYVAVGVDRLDYTKGLVERVSGVERFLEKYPEYVGKFSFVEMGTPSRTNIPSYRTLIAEVEGAIERVNQRFGSGSYRPIILLKGHYDWNEVAEFYQLGQVCLVTSLHDGMNLVAKEYVWSQEPEEGALILSRFTGAARELSEALIVNPYSSEEIADALNEALSLTPEQRGARMRRMKEKVRGHNAFHWATDLLAGVSAKA